MTPRWAPTCGFVVVTLLLAGCGGATAGSSALVTAPVPPAATAPSAAPRSPAVTGGDDPDCGSAMTQGWTSALSEDAGFPTVEEAIAHSRSCDGLPEGEVDVDDPAEGRVRSGGQVVAEFTLADLPGGWYVTGGSTCDGG